MKMKHIVKNLHNGTVNIALVGVGGTGSLVLSGLVRLNHALRQLGHPGIEVKVYDASSSPRTKSAGTKRNA